MKLTMLDAAVAIGTTKKTIEKWLQNGVVTLPLRSAPGKMALFSGYDLCFLTLMRELNNWGVVFRVATGLVQRVFDEFGISREDDISNILEKTKRKFVVYLAYQHGNPIVGIANKLTMVGYATLNIHVHALFADVAKRTAMLPPRKRSRPFP